MKVYVINLKRSPERLEYMRGQLDALGIPFERFEAVEGAALGADERRKAVSAFRWWCAVGRETSPAEVGCAMSHYGIYRRATEPVCILEDDVELSPEFPAALAEAERTLDPGRPQVVLFSDRWNEMGRSDVKKGIVRSRDGVSADGYVITPAAAKKLLEVNFPLVVPCDNWSRWARRGQIEFSHSFPPSVRHRDDVFGSSTSELRNSRPRLPPARLVLHKAARLVGLAIDAFTR